MGVLHRPSGWLEMKIEVVSVVAWLASFPSAAHAQAAAQIGGAPPKEIVTEVCTISDVFGKLQGITTNEACRSGCAAGTCPAGWMPSAADQCGTECGRVFEPFCAIALAPDCLLPVP